MQERCYAFYVFTVQRNGGLATTLLLVDFEDLSFSRGRSQTPRFCIKMTAKDARTAIKNHFAYKQSVLKCQGKKLKHQGGGNHPLRQTRVNQIKSSVTTVQCGVPQGSVLEPLLLIIFLNDNAFCFDNLSFCNIC